MDNRYEIADTNGMSHEFADWFFDNKKTGCGNVWFMMMAAMWEGWKGAPQAGSAAIRDVISEHQRQVSAEGWTPEHDDAHDNGELSYAAICYASQPASGGTTELIDYWPWDKSWWKPTTERRNLVKAGALILADIERLDRANKEQK